MLKLSLRGVAWLPVAAVIALVPAIATAATIFTDRDAWQASAPGAMLVETFENNIGTADSIMFDSGIIATKSTPGVPATLNRVNGGDYDGFVVRDDFRTITWTLPQPVTAFGADFSGGGSNFASLFVTAQFTDSPAETFSIADALGNAAGFLGFSGSQTVSSLLFTTDAGVVFFPGAAPAGGQLFSVDNVALASAPPIAPVPLPATLPLMLGLLGIGGAFGWRHRRIPSA